MSNSFITTDTKSLFLDLYRQDIEGDANYYLALSGADSSSAGLFGQNQARNEMNFVKVISNKSFVVPNTTWSSGQTYNAYDDNDPDQTLFYVVNSLNEVFVCIESKKNDEGVVQPSTQEPTGAIAVAFNSKQNTFYTSDGYLWRYLYKLTGLAINSFKTNTYLPVSKVRTTTSSIAEISEQFNLQSGATAGEILSLAIDSGGTGYTFAPRITVVGNGTGASFSCEIDEGKIVNVTVDSDGLGGISHGSGYDYANVTLTGDGGGVLRAVFGPKEGINADPVRSLRSSQFMVNTEIQNNENGTIPLADPVNDFKQVMLLRNPTKFGTDSDFISNAGNAMNYFEVVSATGTFIADEIFENGDGNQAKVYWHDRVTSPERLYYVQNHTTGFNTFGVGQTLTGTTGTQAVIGSNGLKNPEIDRYSGDVLYINNLETAIDRTSTQTEDIKIVIDLGQEG